MNTPSESRESPTPWWKRGWGITYLLLLAVTIVSGLAVVALPIGRENDIFVSRKAGYLAPVVLVLDVLVAIPIAVGIFQGRLRDLHAADRLILFALATGGVVMFSFFACVAV